MSAAEGNPVPAQPTDPTPSSGMPRLLKWLGLLAVIGGIVIAVVMTMFDEICGRNASAMGSLQVLGIVVGICGAIFGLLLYAIGSFSLIDERQRMILAKLDTLATTGVTTEAAAPAVTGHAPAPAIAKMPAPQPKALITAPIRAPVTRPEPERPAVTALAPTSGPQEGPEEQQDAGEEAAGEEGGTEEQPPAEPAIDALVAPMPQQPEVSADIPEAQTRLAPTEPVAQEPQPDIASQPQEAQRPAYDYSTAAAPNAQSCPVCGGELEDGKCPHCDMSARIQEEYYEISKAQGLGASIEEANSLLNSARQSLDEKAYDEAGEFVRSARNNILETTKLFSELQMSVSNAAASKEKLEGEGKDTLQLAKLIPDARRALEEGRYPETKSLLEQIHKNIVDLEKPPAPKSAMPEPPKRAEISACPKCAKKVMAGWKKCPYCLTPLV